MTLSRKETRSKKASHFAVPVDLGHTMCKKFRLEQVIGDGDPNGGDRIAICVKW